MKVSRHTFSCSVSLRRDRLTNPPVCGTILLTWTENLQLDSDGADELQMSRPGSGGGAELDPRCCLFNYADLAHVSTLFESKKTRALHLLRRSSASFELATFLFATVTQGPQWHQDPQGPQHTSPSSLPRSPPSQRTLMILITAEEGRTRVDPDLHLSGEVAH